MRRSQGFAARALSMTPLIDVIFLLLLFFMLTSTFTRFAEVPLFQARAGSAAQTEPPGLFLRLSAEGLKVNGQLVTEDFEAAIAAHMDGEEATGVLSLSSDVSSQSFVETLRGLQAIPGLSVTVLR